MRSLSFGRLSPTARYYQVRGRAEEIALSGGAGPVAGEHLLLAMLHDGSWPVIVCADAGLLDPERAETAVVAAMNAPDYTPSAPAPLAGRGIAAELGDSHLGVEHAFLEIIRDHAGLPARALAAAGDLDEMAATVLAARNAPARAPADAAFLPDGQDLDADLLTALEERVPAGASFGFNHLDGRTWIHVWGSGVDPGASGAVLDAALTALGRR